MTNKQMTLYVVSIILFSLYWAVWMGPIGAVAGAVWGVLLIAPGIQLSIGIAGIMLIPAICFGVPLVGILVPAIAGELITMAITR